MNKINAKDLMHRKEKLYGAMIDVVSFFFWIIPVLGIFRTISSGNGVPEWILGAAFFGLIFTVLIISIVVWLIGQYFKAVLFGDGVRVSSKQHPTIFEMVISQSERLGLSQVPEIFIYSGDGLISSVAIAFLKKRYVILNSNLVDLMLRRGKGEELSFVIGKELAHHALSHTSFWRQIFIKPALFVPLLGSAYYRSWALSTDRVAAILSGNASVGQNAMIATALGADSIADEDRIDIFIEQEFEIPALMGFLHKIFSYQPRMTRRVIELRKFTNENLYSKYSQQESVIAVNKEIDGINSNGQDADVRFTVKDKWVIIVFLVILISILYVGYKYVRNENGSESDDNRLENVISELGGGVNEADRTIDDEEKAEDPQFYKVLIGPSGYISTDFGWERIDFTESDGVPNIIYVDNMDGEGQRSLGVNLSDESIYFKDKPGIQYYLTEISAEGFLLKNPDGKIQRFRRQDLIDEFNHK